MKTTSANQVYQAAVSVPSETTRAVPNIDGGFGLVATVSAVQIDLGEKD